MPESAAYLETASGQKYLVQLCKHFAHKIAVTYTESRGDCRFPRGAAVLQADENGLSMVVTAADEEGATMPFGFVLHKRNPFSLHGMRQQQG